MVCKIVGFVDLLDLLLLYLVLVEGLWGDVLCYLGVEVVDNFGGICFQDVVIMWCVMVVGLGVGLILIIDVEEDLKLGKLVVFLGCDIMQGMLGEQVFGFYLVLLCVYCCLKFIVVFCVWVEGENWCQFGVQKF